MRLVFIEKCICLILCVLAAFPLHLNAQRRGFEIVTNQAARRVDILIEGQLFTSYIWAEDLKKPILYPLRTANQTIITRGFPIEPRAGESIDHPHQMGLWFNYGDVNGIDFWNNSTSRTPPELAKMGTIVHRRIVETKNGKARGELKVEMDWLLPDGKPILRETTKFIFYAGKNSRAVDRITTLTALDRRVVFNDNKEGVLGLRVRRELEQPAKVPIQLTGTDGKPSEKPVLDNTNVTGQFFSSEGKTGDEVWGTRAKWAILTGKIENERVTLAIFDHPENIGFPTYWMARGYGLFAANPLGQKIFSTDQKEPVVRELKLTLEPKSSVTFRHRLLILSETAAPEQIETQFRLFTGEKK